MPIRFRCKQCSQVLGIASRKAGADIACPKCGCAQTVPAESTVADGGTPSASMSPTPESALTGADLMACDSPASAIENLPFADREATTPGRTPAVAQALAAASAQAPVMAPRSAEVDGQPIPSGMILYPRQTFYLQALLFLILAAVAFGAGYFIGRGDAAYEKQVSQEQAKRVPVEGKLIYDPGNGKIVGDEGAVIVFLPAGKTPEKTLPIGGLRPQDPLPPDSHKGAESIRKLGGAYGRADASGNFYVVAPDQGKYRVLLISAHAVRPNDSPIEEADLAEMEKYFAMAGSLVNRYKYRWTQEEIRIDIKPIELNFGRDGKR